MDTSNERRLLATGDAVPSNKDTSQQAGVTRRKHSGAHTCVKEPREEVAVSAR